MCKFNCAASVIKFGSFFSFLLMSFSRYQDDFLIVGDAHSENSWFSIFMISLKLLISSPIDRSLSVSEISSSDWCNQQKYKLLFGWQHIYYINIIHRRFQTFVREVYSSDNLLCGYDGESFLDMKTQQIVLKMTKTVPDIMLKVGIEVHLKMSKIFNALFIDNHEDISSAVISPMKCVETCSLVQQQYPVWWQSYSPFTAERWLQNQHSACRDCAFYYYLH